MELLQLEYFLKAAELEHMSKAAEALNITQPTLSTTIQRLEAELGCRLFDRQGRGIKLNACGDHFLRHARRILEDVDAAQKDISDYIKQMNSTVTICGPSMFLFPGLMDSILSKYPNVIITYIQNDSEIERLLLSQELDFCISALRFPGQDIISDYLNDKKLAMLVSSSSELASRGSICIADIENIHLASLKMDFTQWTWTYFEELCGKAGFSPKVTYEARSFRDIMLAVKSGKYSAVLLKPRSMEDPAISVLEISDAAAQPIYISYSRKQQDNKLVYGIICAIKDYFHERS